MKPKRLAAANKNPLFKSNANTGLTSGLDRWCLGPETCVYILLLCPLEAEQMSRQMALLTRNLPELSLSAGCLRCYPPHRLLSALARGRDRECGLDSPKMFTIHLFYTADLYSALESLKMAVIACLAVAFSPLRPSRPLL